MDEGRLTQKKRLYKKFALTFFIVEVGGTFGFSTSDCITGFRAVTNNNFTMIVYMILAAGFLSSGYNLLVNLR